MAHPRGRRGPGRSRPVRQTGLARVGGRGRPAGAPWGVPRAFDELVSSYGMTSAPFGHFGDGCMHVRLDLPLDQPDGTRVMREFLTESARLVGEFGGSLSGEHGDGRARSELLPHMYSPDAIALFAGIKHAFDPDNLLNPGVLVDPDPVDADVRPAGTFPRPAAWPWLTRTTTATSARPCTAAPASASAAPTTPPPAASCAPRTWPPGRRRTPPAAAPGCCRRSSAASCAWSHPSVHDAMDLCLSCKGCASDCPTGIDMATYKSEVLHQTYRRRICARARTTPSASCRCGHGWRAATPRLANAALTLPRASAASLLWLAGVDRRRSVPALRPAPVPPHLHSRGASDRKPVVLFADSFTDAFSPEVADATVRVLRDAGYEPRLPSGSVCCGLTWITTGQLDAAEDDPAPHRRRPRRRTPAPACPSSGSSHPAPRFCAPTSTSCSPETRTPPRSPSQVRTLAELLAETPGWTPPDLTGRRVIAQPHCHHHAVLGWKTDADLLAETGATVQTPGRLLRPGRELRRRDRPLRGLRGRRRAEPAARPRRDPGRRRPGRRVLLPHPGRRPSQPAQLCTWPSCLTPAAVTPPAEQVRDRLVGDRVLRAPAGRDRKQRATREVRHSRRGERRFYSGPIARCAPR